MANEADRLWTRQEVAAFFRVNPRTVTEWALSGQLESVIGRDGNRRYPESKIREAIARTHNRPSRAFSKEKP